MEANHEAQGMTFHIHCFGDLYLVAQNRLHRCRLCFTIRHCPVVNTGDCAQPSPIEDIQLVQQRLAWSFVRAWMRVWLAETRAVSVSERLLRQVEIHDHPHGS